MSLSVIRHHMVILEGKLIYVEREIPTEFNEVFREDLPQVYSSRAGLIGYIFGSWIREEIDVQTDLSQSSVTIEQVMKQLQRDHSSGKLRSTAAESARQSLRDVRGSESDISDKKAKKRNGKIEDRSKRASANLPVHIPLVEPARSVSTPAKVFSIRLINIKFPTL